MSDLDVSDLAVSPSFPELSLYEMGLAEAYAVCALPLTVHARVFRLGDGIMPSEGALLGLAWELWREHPASSEDDVAWMPWSASMSRCSEGFIAAMHMRKGPGLEASGVTMRVACLALIGKVVAFQR